MGIYGNYNEEIDLSSYSEYEVASPQEVEKGFAQIICTVDETGPSGIFSRNNQKYLLMMMLKI